MRIIYINGILNKYYKNLNSKLVRKINNIKILDEAKENMDKIEEDEKLVEDQVKLSLNKTEIDVAINLRQALKNPGSNADIFLENGDKLIIPKVNKLILIDGQKKRLAKMGFQNSWKKE